MLPFGNMFFYATHLLLDSTLYYPHNTHDGSRPQNSPSPKWLTKFSITASFNLLQVKLMLSKITFNI